MNKKDNVIPFVPPIPKEIKENMGYYCHIVNTVYGCTLYLYLPNEQIRKYRLSTPQIRLFFMDVNGFPIIHMEVKIVPEEKNDNGTLPMVFDCFFNIDNEMHMEAYMNLMKQEVIPIYWYNEDKRYVRCNEYPWEECDRNRAYEIGEAVKHTLRTHGAGNFDDAKIQYLRKKRAFLFE
ncbi:MAG: hypothetical protein ACOX4N_00135 [Dethiobacteraceae bacterium]|jgi:hypothetical protein